MDGFQSKDSALYNCAMPKNVIHISESEAASNFALVMTRVREGAEVIIERDAKAVAVVRPADAVRGRPISESIALAEAHAKELGYEPTMDPDFAADLEEIIKSRKPRNISTWE
jgi:antitoxin (DNA-binding transcriptional repressor) of toxin-antitoxin stability system